MARRRRNRSSVVRLTKRERRDLIANGGDPARSYQLAKVAMRGIPRAPRRRGGGSGGGNAMVVARNICALTDPFCSASAGTKWPDNTAGATIAYRSETLVTLTTDATGNFCFVAGPGFPYSTLAQTGNTVGGVATFAATYAANASSNVTFASDVVSEVRCVSFGLTVEGIASATNSAGYFVLQEVSFRPNVSATAQTPDLTGGKCMLGSLKNGKAAWISTPRGSAAFEFGGESTTTLIPTNMQDWTSCVIHVAGAPAGTSVLMIRLVGNYEMTIDFQDALYAVAKPTPPKPALTQAASTLRSTMGTMFEGAVAGVTRFIEDKAYSLAMRGLNTLGGYIMGGPAGAAFGSQMPMIMDVD